MSERPRPSEILIAEYVGEDFFIPSPELDDWIRNSFLNERSPLYNPEHEHLNAANIGFLWTNVPHTKKMRMVAGQAEYPNFKCGVWQKHRQQMQLTEWFGEVPDFVITLDAGYCNEASDTDFCALVEHELYHCAQKVNEDGEPVFNSVTERPVFAMKDHDVSEFVGVVRRYGIGSVANGREFIEAASNEPEIAEADISQICGTCS